MVTQIFVKRFFYTPDILYVRFVNVLDIGWKEYVIPCLVYCPIYAFYERHQGDYN